MGPKYYAARRLEYQDMSSVATKLVPTNPGDAQDEGLAEVLLGMIESQRDIQPFIDWAEQVADDNNFNMIALYRHGIAYAPSKRVENTTFGLTLMELVKRFSLHTKYPEPWALMRDYFDKALQSSLTHHKKEGRNPSWWWRSVASFADLILPQEAMRAVMTCDTDWSSIDASVEQVYHSSETGRILMDRGMKQVSLERLSKDIGGSVQAMMAKEEITNATFSAAREKFTNDMKNRCSDVNKTYDKPKQTDCQYRGVKIGSWLFATPPIDEWNLVAQAAIRGVAPDLGLVDPMWCEHDLVGQRSKPCVKIDSELLVKCTNFREALHGLLSYEEATAKNIMDIVKRKSV